MLGLNGIEFIKGVAPGAAETDYATYLSLSTESEDHLKNPAATREQRRWIVNLDPGQACCAQLIMDIGC